MEWSEWKYSGLPELGDYVQIEVQPTFCNKPMRRVQGVVTAIDEFGVRLTPQPENWCICWAIERWRVLKPPEFKVEEHRKKEVDA